MNSAEKLRLLRRRMQEQGMDAYVVVTDDFHGSEYVGDYFKAREYLSGFTGSAGTLVVLPDSAALWTDGRYFLQAADQLAGSTIDLMRAGKYRILDGVPDSDWKCGYSEPEYVSVQSAKFRYMVFYRLGQ